MNRTINVKCPYCECKNSFERNPIERSTKMIVTCCLEKGGCDVDFVIMVRIELEVEAFRISQNGVKND